MAQQLRKELLDMEIMNSKITCLEKLLKPEIRPAVSSGCDTTNPLVVVIVVGPVVVTAVVVEVVRGEGIGGERRGRAGGDG
ncbi:hypothetical protein M0802_007821 [Mischocyttarus mexicanus]|nr:hypothetical protein M0802_007821 [Mischocyttarus mexicanus]